MLGSCCVGHDGGSSSIHRSPLTLGWTWASASHANQVDSILPFGIQRPSSSWNPHPEVHSTASTSHEHVHPQVETVEHEICVVAVAVVLNALAPMRSYSAPKAVRPQVDDSQR